MGEAQASDLKTVFEVVTARALMEHISNKKLHLVHKNTCFSLNFNNSDPQTLTLKVLFRLFSNRFFSKLAAIRYKPVYLPPMRANLTKLFVRYDAEVIEKNTRVQGFMEIAKSSWQT